MLEVGTKAPEICLKDQNGKEIKLSDYRGHKVIIFFYAKDNTSGCTKQAIGYSDLIEQFDQKDAIILGISKDSVASHKKFEEKYGLHITLLADEDKTVLTSYDVWKEKNMYGKKVMGTVRSSYLIDEEGTIIKAFAKVKPEENACQMLAEL